ncbi:PREDICTED: protein CURVATURE THYLAKOID 1B, chloroplastic [Camelina sativa]|uniref:Protein CURVATURE THYLAKOID 1B, chloroplastic n=1 Tax=Camelina sativa TaxID=90675 RepID=A0ABM0YYM0_CAMSA|nr:PREDICTED: protein CURVATURE THYLAKOID 1B, chloroplastic [Camelina sativa]XP_010507969.1 PREDICTED: protein CURVATURE THYLAKOID 1B, chloroplastic [Camelina sativa]
MASFSVSSSSTIIDARAPPSRQPSSASASSPSCISLPTLPPPPIQSQNRAAKATAYCRKIVRNVVTRATTEVGEAPATTTTTTDADSTELPEIVKTAQQAWEKVEDKYAIGSLALAGSVALWGSAGMISAIDRLPLVPGVFELVGIGYTGWFTYKNLIFKPDREALFQKVKNTYKDILGSS